VSDDGPNQVNAPVVASPAANPARNPATSGNAASQQIARSLRLLRKSIRVHLLWTRAGVIAAVLAGVVAAAAMLDYALGLPMGVRLVVWVFGVAALVWAGRKWLVPAARFTAPLSVLALRVERSEQGKRAGWEHKLTAALELGDDAGASAGGGSPALREAALQDLARSVQASKIQISGLLERASAVRAALALGAALGLGAGMFALAPKLTSIGIARAVTPWRDVAWPKRTAVVLAEMPGTHARGSALPVRALLVRSDKPASRERVTASVRVRVEGRVVSEQDVVLSHQATRGSTPVGGSASGARVEGDVFERLLDTQGLVPAGTAAAANVEVEVSARTSDDATQTLRVRLVEPPRIVAMDAVVTPPAYVAALLAAEAGGQASREGSRASALARSLVQGDKALVRTEAGAGEGQAGSREGSGPVSVSLGPVLAGSRVELRVGFEQPMPSEGARLAEVAPGIAALGTGNGNGDGNGDGTGAGDVPTLHVAGSAWTLAWTAQESVRTTLLPVGSEGIAARDEAGLRVEVVGDASPSVSVAQPASDESVLASAVVPIEVLGRDDVAMDRAGAWVRRAPVMSGATDGEGAGQEGAADGAQASDAGVSLGELEAGDVLAGQLLHKATLSLSEVALADGRVKPGDELWIVGWAQDKAGQASGRARVESSIRRLTIISESELASQVASEMAGLRDAAARLEQEQARLAQQREQTAQQMQRATTAGEAQEAAAALRQQAAGQNALTQRTKALEQRVGKLSERLQRNRLDDAALKGLLEDAQETAQEAGATSDGAQQALRTLSEQPRDGAVRDAAQARAREAQTQTQQALAELASTLDTKQDDWSVQRELERILTEQRQLRAQTQTASGRTQGQEAAELSREDKAELDRLARRQDELAQRTRDGLAALDARAQQLAEQSPEQAQTMSQAASEGREGQASGLQQQAARQIRENKTGQAQQAQADAERALERALRKLEDVQQAREEQLRRTLADVMQSLDALIASQRAALEQLAPALAGEAKPTAAELAQGMIGLQRNTLGTIARLKSDERQARALEAVLGNMQAASDAQAAAIVVLRADAPDFGEADREERVSLQRLEDAKAEAEKLQEEGEERRQQRQREELRERYEQMLEQHLGVQTATKQLAAEEQTRRTRATARQLALQQKLVRDGLAQIRSETEGLAEVKVFDFAHTRLESTLVRIGATLEQGNATQGVVADQATVTGILASLVEALKSEREKEDDLQDAGGGGGGGGGGQQGGPQPLVPPLAELVLLRGMQAETNARTAQLENAGDAAEIAQTAELQQQLANLAQQLLDALQQQQGGPAGPENPAKLDHVLPQEGRADEGKAGEGKPDGQPDKRKEEGP
jgi:hypothetical protein